MKQSTQHLPTADLSLLKTAGLVPEIPMSIAALQSFHPLDREQIRERVTAQSPTHPNPGPAIFFPGSGTLSGQTGFTLVLDHVSTNHLPTLRIAHCRNFTIHHRQPFPSSEGKFIMVISNCTDFSIQGLQCDQAKNMLLITDSSGFIISDCGSANAEGSGITVHNSNNFKISRCSFHNTLSAGILIIGHSFNGDIQDCICTHTRGRFNQDAGIHLCATSPEITSAQIPEYYHEPLPITGKPQRPHHIMIRNCTLTRCRAQGIYLEGAINCLLENNILSNNNKEGICFDWGSSYNIFHNNIVSLNGERGNLSPEEIQADFISQYPLLEDGSSSMKLPGISIDNGCMNLIQENKITSNHGGGIKMIRTALFNAITCNSLLDNTIGANRYVPYFHGITILGIGAINNEFDTTRPTLLDFTPSLFNHITRNTIKESGCPIFCDRPSSNNTLANNIIPRQVSPHGFVKKTWCRTKAFIRRLYANHS